MGAEVIFPAEQLAAARSELAAFRRDRAVQRPSMSDGAGCVEFDLDERANNALIPTLLMVVAIELRELRSLMFQALTVPGDAPPQAAPAAVDKATCQHPIEFRVDHSRMGQEPGTEFQCSLCKAYVVKEQAQ